MPKAPTRSSPKRVAKVKRKSGPKGKIVIPAPTHGLVSFSFQNIDYQIDLDKSKVYRRFVEVEKSRTSSIITAYRTGGVHPRAAL